MAGLYDKERTEVFMAKFPGSKLSVTTLRRFYAKNNIKAKAVRQEKRMPPHALANYTAEKQRILRELDEARRQGRRILYVDEICFTKTSIMNRCWSKPNENITVD